MFVKAKILKKLAVFFAVIIVFDTVAFLSAPPLIILMAKAQLSRIFKGSTVTVTGCVLKPAGRLILSGIEIKSGEIYNFSAKEAAAEFSWFSLLTGKITSADIHGVSVRVHTPSKKTADFPQYLRLSSGKSLFSIEQIRISNASIDITTQDFTVKAALSIDLDLQKQILTALELKLDFLNAYNINMEEAALSVRQKDENGRLQIRKICYNNKLTVTDIESPVVLRKDILFLNGLFARLLGGDIRADVKLRLDKNFDYLVNVKAQGITLEQIVSDFELKDKFQMSGSMGGEIGLRGSGPKISFLNSDFTVASPGGTLIITDARFLDTIAKKSGQYLDAVTESFKNYRYASGTARVYKEAEDYVLQVSLDGEQGKRNFKIIVGFNPLRRNPPASDRE